MWVLPTFLFPTSSSHTAELVQPVSLLDMVNTQEVLKLEIFKNRVRRVTPQAKYLLISPPRTWNRGCNPGLQAEGSKFDGVSTGSQVNPWRITICPELIQLKFFFPLDFYSDTSRMLQHLDSHKTETLQLEKYLSLLLRLKQALDSYITVRQIKAWHRVLQGKMDCGCSADSKSCLTVSSTVA